MALFDTIKSLLGNQTETASKSGGGKVYIVDAAKLQDGNKKQLSPHQKIQILKKLAGFVKRENVQLEALFEGKPLRVVDEGGDFSGVTVYYTRGKLDMAGLVEKRIAALGDAKATVISDDQNLESRLAESGAEFMRAGTFKKALGMGKSRSRGGRSSNQKQKPKSGKRKSRQNKSKNTGKNGKDRVSDLIDLVE